MPFSKYRKGKVGMLEFANSGLKLETYKIILHAFALVSCHYDTLV